MGRVSGTGGAQYDIKFFVAQEYLATKRHKKHKRELQRDSIKWLLVCAFCAFLWLNTLATNMTTHRLTLAFFFSFLLGGTLVAQDGGDSAAVLRGWIAL